jgi:hypothetical protein
VLRLKRAEEHATKRTLEKIEEDDRKTAELKERQRQMQQVMSLPLLEGMEKKWLGPGIFLGGNR